MINFSFKKTRKFVLHVKEEGEYTEISDAKALVRISKPHTPSMIFVQAHYALFYDIPIQPAESK